MGAGEAKSIANTNDHGNIDLVASWGLRPHPADEIAVVVVSEALSARPRRAGGWWHPVVVERCVKASVEPPTRSRFGRMVAAERARRRSEHLVASRRAIADLVATVADRRIEVIPGYPPVDGRDVGFAAAALTVRYSSRVGEAFFEYVDVARASGASFVCKPVFVALVHSPLMVENMPAAVMPEWWRRAMCRSKMTARARPVGTIGDDGGV